MSVVATTVIFLGTAGLFMSQLISFALFDQFFRLRHKLIKSPGKSYNHTTEEWFNQLARQLVPQLRETPRDGDHDAKNRRPLTKLSQGQIHAALHALEINCREKHPELASQIEQFYSMYVTFSILGLVSAAFATVHFLDLACFSAWSFHLMNINISTEMAIVDIMIWISCFIAALHARRLKELLRLKMLNISRIEAISLLSKWYQVELPESRIVSKH